MKKVKEITDEQCGLFNAVRDGHKGVYSTEEIMNILKDECNLPGSYPYVVAYVKYGLIVKLDKNKYCFTKDPIYKKKFKEDLQKIRNYFNESSRKSRENNQEKITVEQAIALLKNKGYKILKPTMNYEEI